MLLELRDMHVGYGAHRVVHGVSLHVAPGELVALLGPNGVGKTTTLSAIAGLLTPTAGQILITGKPMAGAGPVQMVRAGVVLCAQGRELFKSLTVRDNLLLGGTTLPRKNDVLAELDKVYELFPRLKDRDQQIAGTMSGGEQQMLAIGRALMAKPRLLLVDEPSSGLAPKIVEFVLDLLRRLVPSVVEGVLLVEQNADAALRISDRACLMQAGVIEAEGAVEAMRNDDVVRRVYLGAGVT